TRHRRTRRLIGHGLRSRDAGSCQLLLAPSGTVSDQHVRHRVRNISHVAYATPADPAYGRAVLPQSPSKGEAMANSANVPTTVLVHGGFADASFWAPVIRELHASDLPVLAPANPLRGLASDAEYIASVVRQVDGPVLLVGHSYGGAVISVAGAAADNVVGLVYVAAFALDEGESFAEIFERFGASPLVDAVRPSDYPLPGGGTAVELSIAPELYRSAFAADLPS